MLDAIVVGAGPAGSVCALVMARAGARVLILDRAAMPGDKLCGDTLNPGAVRFLDELGLDVGFLDGRPRLRGTVVRGLTGGPIRCDYAAPAAAVVVRRRELDRWLLESAIGAGARFASATVVRGPLLDDRTGMVRGVVTRRLGAKVDVRLPALVVVGADGRRSTLARQLRLQRPAVDRRWAFGAYVTGASGMTDADEIHLGAGTYSRVVSLGDGCVNVCVVKRRALGAWRPADVVHRLLSTDERLVNRLGSARVDGAIRGLGPLSVATRAVGVPGLLLAGDAAAGVDPISGDGMHLAMRSGYLTAIEALRALETGQFVQAVSRLAHARRSQFGAKLRFDRAVGRLMRMPVALDAASLAARLSPSFLRGVVNYAGDAR